MSLRRGFKAEANRIALDVRRHLGLLPIARLDPRRLAEHLGIALLPLSSFSEAAPGVVAHFADPGRDAFSALTLVVGEQRAIVFNDAHSNRRQTSDLAHELAHHLLGHAPELAVTPFGCRAWDADSEDEADWLGAALLVPEEAALRAARIGLTLGEAAWSYRVSCDLMRWRLSVTGARRRVARRGGA